MQVLNYSTFRAKLKENLDLVSQSDETVIVNRSKGENVVVISLKEYNAIQETLYLMSTENNRKRLLGAIEDEKKGIFEVHDLILNENDLSLE
ncbi:MAG: type II toxin-antitoxin system prevent-host-death family antitoxin [Saprospiraceae bacterium]